jgi:protein tyrosine/serine phosphatase
MSSKKSGDTQNTKQKRKHLRLILIILLIGGAIWTYDELVKYRIFPKRFGVVEEGVIYRSGQISASVIKKTLQKHNIGVIIMMSGDAPQDYDQQSEKKVAEELGIDLYNFPLKGNGTGDVNNYLKSLLTVYQAKQERKPVLVHCSAGAQRTGGVVALYRFFFQKKDADFVLRELKKYGWKYKSNPYLPAFLNENMRYLAEKLVG